MWRVRKVAYIGVATPTKRSPTRMVERSFWGSLRRCRASFARLFPVWASACSFVELTEKKPISAVEITAERTIRPKRIRTSMDCDVLEATDYDDQAGIQESPGSIPYRPGAVLCDLGEPRGLIAAYRTCIHCSVHVPQD